MTTVPHLRTRRSAVPRHCGPADPEALVLAHQLYAERLVAAVTATVNSVQVLTEQYVTALRVLCVRGDEAEADGVCGWSMSWCLLCL